MGHALPIAHKIRNSIVNGFERGSLFDILMISEKGMPFHSHEPLSPYFQRHTNNSIIYPGNKDPSPSWDNY